MRYSACVMNGCRYHTVQREERRRTQNSGIVVPGSHEGNPIEFYGRLVDIYAMQYLRGNTVYLFKCDWWDVGDHRGIRIDVNFKSINTSRLWYLEDPFVLANQASQVFYLVDNLHGPTWRVVQKLSCRNAYDIPGLDPDGEVDVNIESGAAIVNEAYQEDDAIDLFIDFLQFNLNPLRRDDVTPNVIQASEAIDRRKKRRIDSNNV